MSEVNRYASDPCNFRFLTWVAVKHGGSELADVVVAQEFDRVTAELDTARETLERWYRLNVQREAKVDALQQRLTAADEELDQCHSMALMIEEKEWAEHVGKGTISSRVESAFTQLHNELTEARQGLAAADERADVLVGLLHKAHPFTNDVAHDVDVWLEIEAELKLVNGDCHHGYASILECPECGEPYQ